MTYQAEDWLLSTYRTLKSYVIDTINAPNVYDVVMEFPGADVDAGKMPLRKIIIHFEIDDIDEQPLGMGDRPAVDNYSAGTSEITPQWAHIHVVNFDVGIWASDAEGGTTSRMRARQWLTRLFSIPEGAEHLRDYSDGGDGVIEILSFSGGRNVIDRVNDMRLYRMVDCTLVCRVFSRTPIEDAVTVPAIDEIDQAPNLTIIG